MTRLPVVTIEEGTLIMHSKRLLDQLEFPSEHYSRTDLAIELDLLYRRCEAMPISTVTKYLLEDKIQHRLEQLVRNQLISVKRVFV